jgi:trehalose 6-phosphate phosphatase
MVPPLCDVDLLAERLARAPALRLYMDYDGTLADPAPTPDTIIPDPELASLLGQLGQVPRVGVAVVSGRRLSHLRALVPVPGLMMAGTYGVQLRWPDGTEVERMDWPVIAPVLDALRPQWSAVIHDQQGFYLEDKGLALALHARFAEDGVAEHTLAAARRLAEDILLDAPAGHLRILDGEKFLEVGPALASKGRTVEYLIQQDPWPGALPVYMGDDNRDEEAFVAVRALGGLAVVVAEEDRPSEASCRLPSPAAVRQLLWRLAAGPQAVVDASF